MAKIYQDFSLEEREQIAQWFLQRSNELQIKNSTFHHMERFIVQGDLREIHAAYATGALKDKQVIENFQQEVEQKISEFEMDIDTGLGQGEACPELEVENCSNGEKLTLKFGDGIVTLVDFWATWCGPCQKPMQHNQDMLDKHPEWQGKAQIISISLDDDRETVNTRIEEKKWNLIRNMFGGSAWQSPSAAKFNVNGIPFCVLVNGEGVIQWTGHPAEHNIESDIETLIKGGQLSNQEQQNAQNPQNDWYNKTFEERKATFQKILEFLSQDQEFEKPMVMSSITRSQSLTGVKPEVFISIRGSYLEEFKSEVEQYIQKIKSFFPAEIQIEEAVRFETAAPKVEKKQNCSLCSRGYGDQDTQYICLYCEGHSHCEECEKKGNIEQGTKSLAHPHLLFQVHPKAQKLNQLRWGRNKFVQPKEINEKPESPVHRGVGCDNRGLGKKCTSSVVGVRWKCAHCPDYDFCEFCQNDWSNPDQEMLQKAKDKGHFPWHVLIKMTLPEMFDW